MIPITEVQDKNSIIETEFIRLDLVRFDGSIEVVAFSAAYKPEVIEGREYSPLGGFLAISSIQKDLETTGSGVSVSLMGIDPDNVYIFMSDDYRILGSQLRLYRGFYDENYNLTSVKLRHTGLINGVDIGENLDLENRTSDHTITLKTESMRSWAMEKISGRTTNSESWKRFSLDKSMDRVALIEGTYFDFGKAPTGSGTSVNSMIQAQAGIIGNVR
jgi:hypothetical protein